VRLYLAYNFIRRIVHKILKREGDFDVLETDIAVVCQSYLADGIVQVMLVAGREYIVEVDFADFHLRHILAAWHKQHILGRRLPLSAGKRI